MNASMKHSLVIQMPTVLTLLAVSCVIANLDTLGVASLVKVCIGITYFYDFYHVLKAFYRLSLDINECEDPGDNPTCHEHANCTDTEGSFECTCNTGFSGDGFNCTGSVTIRVIPISSGTLYVF